jgi:hypothetical protein
VNALAIGQWYEIPNTKLSSVDPSPVPPGVEGPQAKVDDWNSFVADSRTSKVYSVANGGHAGYGGNEVDALELDREVPRWVQVLAPTPNASITGCVEYYADGRPTSRHTYYGVLLNEFEDRIMLLGGSWYCSTGTPFLSTMDSYNISGNSYSPAGTHPRLPSPFGTTYYVSYTSNPLTGDIYAISFRQIGRWNRSTNTFTANLSPTGSAPWGGDQSAFDTSRGRIAIVGGQNIDHAYYTLASNSWTGITLTGANAPNITNLGQAGMFYVAAIDKYLVRALPAGGTVYQIDASTFEVTTFTTTGGSSIPVSGNVSVPNGPYNRFLYLPRLGGAVYVPSYSGNAWFLRLH